MVGKGKRDATSRLGIDGERWVMCGGTILMRGGRVAGPAGQAESLKIPRRHHAGVYMSDDVRVLQQRCKIDSKVSAPQASLEHDHLVLSESRRERVEEARKLPSDAVQAKATGDFYQDQSHQTDRLGLHWYCNSRYSVQDSFE